MKLVTNLDRKAIEGKLAEVRAAAQGANLKELADVQRHRGHAARADRGTR